MWDVFPIVFYIRLFLVGVWVLLASLMGTIYSIMRWGNLNINRDFARFYSWGALKLLGIELDMQGLEYLEMQKPCIYVANHQSNLDMAVFGMLYPSRTLVIGKKELKWFPIFGIFFVASGNIMIDRSKKVKAVAGLSQAVEIIKKKAASIWIFPEGTRNRQGSGLLPFKRGAFHMAIQAKIPVVPMVSSQLWRCVDFKKRRIYPGVMKIRVLPPVETSRLRDSDADQLGQEVREKLLEALHGLNAN